MSTKTKESTPRWCVECYHVSKPDATIQKKDYLIGGYWCKVGVPTKQMVCGACKQWVDVNAFHDVHDFR